MLSERIKTLRKKKGMSQEELALELHVVRQTISKWENALSVPDADELIHLAKALEVSVNSLLGMEEKESLVYEDLVNELARVNEELAEICEQERLVKQANRIRGKILFLVIISLIFISVIKNELMQVVAVGVCIIVALCILYKNLAALTIVATKDLKLKALRTTTIFNMIVIGMCIAGSVITGTGMVKIGPAGEKFFAAFLVSAVLLFMGYISPKLPFTRHTGLRLPWTVADEETWNVAHRILGIVAIPIGVFYIGAVPFVKDFEALTVGTVLMCVAVPGIISAIFYYHKFYGKNRKG